MTQRAYQYDTNQIVPAQFASWIETQTLQTHEQLSFSFLSFPPQRLDFQPRYDQRNNFARMSTFEVQQKLTTQLYPATKQVSRTRQTGIPETEQISWKSFKEAADFQRNNPFSSLATNIAAYLCQHSRVLILQTSITVHMTSYNTIN